MAAIRSAWAKVREAVRSARTKLGGTAPIQKTKSGFARVGGGIGWATAGTRRGIGNATAGTRSQIGKARRAVSGGVGKAIEAPRDKVEGWIEEARGHPTLAVGIAAGALVGVAWIAWAVYVTASNGTTAGLGVLITWPVLIGALALIAAPFVLTGVLVQRHRGTSEPALAGGPSITEEPADKSGDKQAENKAESEDEDAATESEEGDEDEADAEASEEPTASSA